MSLEQLDLWIDALEPKAPVDGVSMMDGYLTANVVWPCSISPDEWFVDLLGARGRIAAAAGKRLAAMTAIVAGFNAISEGLSTAPGEHAPIFEKTEDGRALPQPWCMGFLGAMRLRSDAWRPLLDLNHIDHGLRLPILIHCTDPLGQAMLGPPREGPETEKFMRNAYHDIPLVILAIRLLDAAARQAVGTSSLITVAGLQQLPRPTSRSERLVMGGHGRVRQQRTSSRRQDLHAGPSHQLLHANIRGRGYHDCSRNRCSLLAPAVDLDDYAGWVAEVGDDRRFLATLVTYLQI